MAVHVTEIIEKVQRRLADDPAATSPATLAALIREEAVVISDVDVLAIMRKLRDDSIGVGPLESLLAAGDVTDICVNGPDEIYVDRGGGLARSSLAFSSDADVRKLATRLATSCGRRLDDAQPFADGHITRDDGTMLRFHAVLAPTSHSGTCISLRVLRSSTATLEQLHARGAMDTQRLELLKGVVERRQAFVVVGGTGTGKTTLLSAMLAAVAKHERIIAIEDTVELTPAHPHVVNLTTRGSNTEGSGEISMSDLLRQALRMRPDRIVVGEIRGAEVVDLLAALNTGHDGGAGTVHANSIDEVPARLEALAALGGLDRAALHSQLAAAVDVVVVMKRTRTGARIVHQIGVLEGNPVSAKVVWDSTRGPLDGYEELAP
ncbi:TadA family conjugal transfer-associated ATPase [Corynebacterium aquatimens]|uniref:Pilus assembly protein CpaF n=1 Tax=Corynebacterium aquatimens TaxID=1190508 RepID=A0A931E2S6_9CORY|nr:TadA family conjugal transfer-associated ATPase [Corynebacterium aquatimens]MBG6122530.1 pilus assembly protein CpaF [Corynebacterium aquatimens]WJY64930.1 Putative conjugal transfer protein [Corynebacterium aquatimens]